MKPHSVIPLLALSLVAGIQGQEAASSASQIVSEPSSRPIRVTSSLPTQFLGPAFNRVTCDGDGNLYARRHQPGDHAKGPVQQITSKGALMHSFRVEDPTLDLSIADFFLAPNDDLYIAGWSTVSPNTGGRIYLAHFGRDGSLKSKTRLVSEEFFPSSLAVFNSGEILLTGTQGSGDNKPFTAVFASNGTLISKVYPPEDEELSRKAEEGDPSAHEAGVYGNSFVEMGGAVGGSDGNVYLMRRTSPALIYVISPKGNIIRTLRIDLGDAKLLPEDIQSANNRLAISFGAPAGGRILKVVNLMGADVATYSIDESLSIGTFACYSPPALTFLSPDKDRRYSDIVRLEEIKALTRAH